MSSDWNTDQNWEGGKVPTKDDAVTIPANTPQCIVTGGPNVKSVAVQQGGTLKVQCTLMVSGAVTNAGAIWVEPNGTVIATTVTNNNTLNFDGGGNIQADLTNANCARVSVAVQGNVQGTFTDKGITSFMGSSGSILSVIGNYTQTATGVLQMQADRTGCSQVTVAPAGLTDGKATIAGSLQFSVPLG